MKFRKAIFNHIFIFPSTHILTVLLLPSNFSPNNVLEKNLQLFDYPCICLHTQQIQIITHKYPLDVELKGAKYKISSGIKSNPDLSQYKIIVHNLREKQNEFVTKSEIYIDYLLSNFVIKDVYYFIYSILEIY